ncbi:hypothetical protein ILUMI_17161, partial [Ignelater luminosus]
MFFESPVIIFGIIVTQSIEIYLAEDRTMEWTNKAVIQFLEAYQAEPCIWNLQHPDHRNRNKVADAWQRLREDLNFNCSLNDLKKKKDSLMASFRMLLNKKKKCGMDGDKLFKPNWFAFETMEKFLAPVYHYSTTIKTETVAIETDTENEKGSIDAGRVNVDQSSDETDSEGADEEILS